ncbi:MAG: AAA family ATPase [Nisaea sp.]|uniref:AAA family ATPase n=1 Tax=Nisaea sp. TaxID=2024842 RepID=UPI003266D000
MTDSDLEYLRNLIEQVGTKKMFGMKDVVTMMMISLVARGHILLEGNPGLGKTAVVKALSEAMNLPEGAEKRIQFTPDLMPSDITGTWMPKKDASNQLEFRPGPVFCQLLIADEINRATPKTQSAMLEAMAEFQVSVLGETRPLRTQKIIRDPDNELAAPEQYLTPFMVMATQNPVDQEGVNPLPEAQLDRFLSKISVPFPKADVLAQILRKEVAPDRDKPKAVPSETDGTEAYVRLSRLNSGLAGALETIGHDTETHILNMVLASSLEFDQVEDLSRKRREDLRSFCTKVEYPLGPRAATALSWAALGWSAIRIVVREGEINQIGPNAWQGLANTVVPVLRHRMKFQIEFDYDDDGIDRIGFEQLRIDKLVAEFSKVCAPDGDGYAEQFAAAVDNRPAI